MKISEVAKQFNLTTSTLRYYEELGLIPPIKRNGSGIREYDEEDIKWIDFIICMRKAGLSIDSLIEFTSLFIEGDHTVKDRKNILLEERKRLMEKLNEIEDTIQRLDIKIKHYDELLTETRSH